MNPDIMVRSRTMLDDKGFIFLSGAQVRSILPTWASLAWVDFAASWNDLAIDHHMADGGRYRRRRHAVLRLQGGQIIALPPQPHFQSLEHNALNGGTERWFAQIDPAIIASAPMQAVLKHAIDTFALDHGNYDVELHQFRIVPHGDLPAMPTPEGMHRDGVDWVAVMLVARCNVTAGVTQIEVDGRAAAAFTLTDPLDCVLLDDRRVKHGVTPISQLRPDMAAYRDVLVVTFRMSA